jgi:RNA polymerase sigma-70 factor (ECF subfamily)
MTQMTYLKGANTVAKNLNAVGITGFTKPSITFAWMESLRPLLTTYAYNILGSVDAAKDVVQDAYLKFLQIDSDAITDKKAYLVRMVINLSINQKKRQKKIVADYTGQWLPEPVATEMADTSILRKEVLSYSLMVLMEKLNPKQRAVFILNEAFEYDHEEIARVLQITVENSRKILSRAKALLHTDAPVPEKKVPADYLDKYLEVIRAGDTNRLEQLLTQDIAVVSDGGGKVVAFMNPILGRESVMAVVRGIHKKFYSQLRIEKGWINHQPAIFYYDENDKLVTLEILSLSPDGHIENIFYMRNPDKLKGLSL